MTRARRAMAMLLVVGVVALCSVIGIAMLLSASVQAQATGNSVAATQAETLADSGVDLACYHLLNPGRAPAFVGEYWPGESGITLGEDVRGTIDLAVTRTAANRYQVRSTGRVSAGPDGGIARSVEADVAVSPGFQVKSGLSFWTTGATIPAGSVVTSDIQTVGTLTLYVPVPGYVLRVLAVNNLTGTALQPLTALTDANKTFVPDATTVRDYLTYSWQGRICSARAIDVASLTNATLNPTEDNPAGVYYRSGSLTLGRSVIINGTLVTTGTLVVTGPLNEITPAAGFPAAVIKGDLDLRCSTTAAPQLRFNGLGWIGGMIRATLPVGMRETSILRGTVSADGALLVRGGTDTPGRYKFWINHNPGRVAGVDLDTSVDPAGVVIKSFK